VGQLLLAAAVVEDEVDEEELDADESEVLEDDPESELPVDVDASFLLDESLLEDESLLRLSLR
jgi:hypothetical protein